jgi:hypothetical protein
MAKYPVTEDGVREYSEIKGGIVRPVVTTGKADPIKARIARKATGSSMGGMYRDAGMMLDLSQNSQPLTTHRMEGYRTSYANGLDQRTGANDVPLYFQQMNEQNGGLLYWPVTLQEKYSWYRYWSITDAYIGRSLELLSDLPMSKLSLTVPNYVPKERREEINDFFEAQLEEIDCFELLMSILWEVNLIGNCHIFHEWDDKRKMWSRAVVLPPEEVFVFEYPFSKTSRIEYRPLRLISIIKSSLANGESLPNGEHSDIPGGNCRRENLNQEILKEIPQEIIDMVLDEGCIVMDTDPTTGSFVHHISRRKSPYQDLGASALERVLVPMLQKEHYRYTQLSLSSRNMTPKNLVTAPGLMPEEVDELRMQIDLSYMDPEYTIICNYEVQWEQIGAQDRLLDLSREYETIDSQIFAAFGVTRELLTGEATLSGSKITIEILNSMFLLSREILKNYLEKKLFKPVAEAHNWYTEDKNGIKKYWYPHVGFNRLTIRDNAEVFDSLFQLYQKGSLPVEIIYELFNLDADRMYEKIKQDLFTVNDSTFNRLVEEVNSEVGRNMVEKSDIVKKTAEYLGLKYDDSGSEESLGEDGFDTDFGNSTDESDSFDFENDSSDNVLDNFAEEVSKDLPSDATDDQIKQAILEKTK